MLQETLQATVWYRPVVKSDKDKNRAIVSKFKTEYHVYANSAWSTDGTDGVIVRGVDLRELLKNINLAKKAIMATLDEVPDEIRVEIKGKDEMVFLRDYALELEDILRKASRR